MSKLRNKNLATILQDPIVTNGFLDNEIKHGLNEVFSHLDTVIETFSGISRIKNSDKKNLLSILENCRENCASSTSILIKNCELAENFSMKVGNILDKSQNDLLVIEKQRNITLFDVSAIVLKILYGIKKFDNQMAKCVPNYYKESEEVISEANDGDKNVVIKKKKITAPEWLQDLSEKLRSVTIGNLELSDLLANKEKELTERLIEIDKELGGKSVYKVEFDEEFLGIENSKKRTQLPELNNFEKILTGKITNKLKAVGYIFDENIINSVGQYFAAVQTISKALSSEYNNNERAVKLKNILNSVFYRDIGETIDFMDKDIKNSLAVIEDIEKIYEIDTDENKTEFLRYRKFNDTHIYGFTNLLMSLANAQKKFCNEYDEMAKIYQNNIKTIDSKLKEGTPTLDDMVNELKGRLSDLCQVADKNVTDKTEEIQKTALKKSSGNNISI